MGELPIVKPAGLAQHKGLASLSVRLVWISLGALLVSFGLEAYLVPNHIIDGGIVGISAMLSYVTGVPLEVFLMLLNVPFLWLGYRHLGRSFAFFTLFGVVVLSSSSLFMHVVPPITKDPILATVIGGVLMGVGIGLVIRFGGCLDGTEIVALVCHKKTHLTIGEITMVMNLFILLAAGFVFGWSRAIYSFITYYIAYKTLDLTLYRFKRSWLILFRW